MAGDEGFLILFHIKGDEDRNWWNIGGWNNAQHAVNLGGTQDSKRGTVESDRWYDVKVSVRGAAVKCYLDGELVHDIKNTLASTSGIYASATRDDASGEVIVKVVRPGIRTTIKRDIGLMYIVAEGLERYWSEGKRLQPTGVVAEFEKTLLDELDLMREAANASQLRRNFRDDPAIHVPEVMWELCRRKVMVMERVSGIRVDDIAALTLPVGTPRQSTIAI